jgi:hypothetical protein
MALSGSMVFRGISLPSAYARIERFHGEQKVVVRAFVSTYATEGAAAEGVGNELTMDLLEFQYDLASPLSLNAQAYEVAKQLPQFVGWRDC